MFVLFLIHVIFLPPVFGTSRSNLPFFFHQHGQINITVVSDGRLQTSANIFDVNDKAVQLAKRRNFIPFSDTLIEQNVAVIDVEGKRLLVDTGSRFATFVPFFGGGGHLLNNLKRAGISPASIDSVLLTHGHPDHVGGLLTKSGEMAFPNAQVFVSKAEHKFWTIPPRANDSLNIDADTYAFFSEVYKTNVAKYGEKLKTIGFNSSPFRGVKFIPSPGHTPGHVEIEITSGSHRLYATGDIWVSKANQVQNPEWSLLTEVNRDMAYRSRIRTMNARASGRNLLLSYHEQFPGLGYLVQNIHAYDWISVYPQISRN